MMPLRAACASAAVVLALGAPPVEAQEPAANSVPVRVEVVTADGSAPLAYSVISVPAQGIERFSDANGRVSIPVRPGRVLMRVKRLGFVPRDTTFTVEDAPGQVVRIALARVSFTLDVVRVVGWPPCRRPGLPRRGGDAQLRGIVDQLKQNAERYRLLTTSYPFMYESERRFSHHLPDGKETTDRTDTISVSGVPAWKYKPGKLVSQDRTQGMNQWIMHIPVLSDLADQDFIDNHCFHVAGLEMKGEDRLLRLDIVAAQRLKSPDVNVSVWLDPVGFQLRHASFTLVGVHQWPNLLHVVSRVDYVEVVPFIPVMHETNAENLVREGGLHVIHNERQTIVRLTFLGARP